MKRRFRSKTVVLRRRYVLWIIPVLCAAVFVFAGLPTISIKPEVAFGSALLCMASREGEKEPLYLGVMKEGNMALAFSPERKTKPEPEAVPDNQDIPEDVVEVQESFLSIPSSGIELRNQTSFSPDTYQLEAADNSFLPVEKDSDKPQVLLFHTHTTESFFGCDRTDDETKNVVAVGSVIADILNKRGINTIHCKTVHDYDYNGSYGKSYETVEKLLSENPSVKVVLDVHRDGITYEDGSGLRVISEVNGKTAGQFMLVVGTDEGGLYHPGWQNNLSFALKIQKHMNEKYPGLARPLNLRSERFNQNLSPGMMIVECGGNGNSLSEVQYGAELFADVLYDVISQQK